MSYLNIKDLPKTHRGREAKLIPKEFVNSISKIPEGKALEMKEKVSIVQSRIKRMVEEKTIAEKYKVVQRTVEGKKRVFVTHEQ